MNQDKKKNNEAHGYSWDLNISDPNKTPEENLEKLYIIEGLYKISLGRNNWILRNGYYKILSVYLHQEQNRRPDILAKVNWKHKKRG